MGKTVFLTGDNLAGNPKKAINMLETIIESNVYQNPRTVQISVSAAKNPKLLKAMGKVGINNLCVGFESITDGGLNDLGKPFSAKQNTEAAKTFRDYGFWVHAMMMVGTDNDTLETVKETVEWAKEYADSVQFFIPVPFKGTRFYDKLEREGRILTRDLSLYDAQHCVIQPKNISQGYYKKLFLRVIEIFILLGPLYQD